jgi:ATP-binding cassette, subfamily B, multidrug efflux pump
MFRFFENLVDPFAPYEERDAPPTRLLAFVRDYVRPFRTVFVFSVLCKMLVAGSEILLIWYLGRIVDILGREQPANLLANHGMEFAVAALLVLIARPIVSAFDTALLHNTTLTNLGALVRWRAHKHVLRQPVGWFENDFAGRIANRIMQTPSSMGDAVFQMLDCVAFALTSVVGASILLIGADARLFIPLAVWILFYLALLRWTARRIGPASKASSDARSTVTGRVVDSYTNIHSVKLFAHDDREVDYAGEAIRRLRDRFIAEMRLVTKMDVMLTALNACLIVMLTGLAVKFWLDGTASTGAVAATTALVLRLTSMTYWVMWATSNLVEALGVVSEGMETIAQPVGLTDAADAPDLQLTRGRIVFENVSHHYGRGSGGIDRISLTIRPGEKIGLIGRSGSGKSTLVKLLLRFYDSEGGRILIDGQDIARVRQASLRAQIGMVQQESSLLHRTVGENILYGRPEATEAEMIAAAERAEAHEFILTLRDPEGNAGYDAQVGERGVKLSGGQRQRVAIARVILKDAPILVLDEATSALDSEAEAAIQATLYGVMEGKTVIAIAHRLSTIARMDRIVVLDDGRIAEEGTHADLLTRGGLYARFWERQSGGFIGTEDAEAAE